MESEWFWVRKRITDSTFLSDEEIDIMNSLTGKIELSIIERNAYDNLRERQSLIGNEFLDLTKKEGRTNSENQLYERCFSNLFAIECSMLDKMNEQVLLQRYDLFKSREAELPVMGKLVSLPAIEITLKKRGILESGKESDIVDNVRHRL